jgi:ribosomal-protein-alanine N-acetyltransferase
VDEIRTTRLVLREFRPDDHAAVHRYAADPEVVRFQNWGPNTPAETTMFLDMVIAAAAATPRTRWALAVIRAADDTMVGACELHVDEPDHRRGSMGYSLARDAWGQGYATEAAAALLRFGFAGVGLHKISATCDPDNVGSVRVLEKIGMTREGQLQDHFLVRGEWRDRLLYAAIDLRIEPAAPDNVPRLLEIRHAAFAAHAPAAYSAEEVATLLTDVDPDELRRMAEAGTLWVARRAGRIVGLAGRQEDRLRHVYIDPEYARQGIATALVDRVERAVRRQTGATRIRAGVALHAEGFYLARGYRLVSRGTAWDGSAYLEMQKEL